MGADNWAVCPRCLKREEARIDGLDAAAAAAYGVETPERYQELVVVTELARQELSQWEDGEHYHATLREDYEFYGISEGVLEIRYSARCTKCSLSHTFTDSQPIAGIDS